MKLVLDDVWKRFGDHDVLRGISLDVRESEVISLIGASGAGKSTLLRCINLLEPVDDGRILLDGDDISEPGRDADPIRRRIGIVFQSFNLFPHMSVLRNVTLGPRKVLGRSRREADASARAMLGRFGLADKADDYPDRLSGGQQQRVAIVRALMMEPELMLLDEITSALDPELVGEVLDVMKQLATDGTTMIVVTHEMAFARDVADQVLVMDAGQVVEQGRAEEVLLRPTNPRTASFLSRFHSTIGERKA
jgi:polar amino acid transport system ATP-binding protein